MGHGLPSTTGVLGSSPGQHYGHPSEPLIPTCQLCNLEGHTALFCIISTSHKFVCHICHRSNHSTWYCF